MKGHLISFIFISFFIYGFGQNTIPQALIGTDPSPDLHLGEIFSNYYELKVTNDSTIMRQRKHADRWLNEHLYKLEIRDDSTIVEGSYREALKSLTESDLYCTTDNLSDWKQIGPKNVGNQNGWISAVLMIPQLSNRLIIGTRKNGIFLSNDGGTTWTCVTDYLPYPVLGIKQLVVDPANHNHIIAVTGTDSGSSDIQTALLHSYDGGTTWQASSNFLLVTNEEIQQIYKISYLPSAPNHLFGVTSDKVIHSSDNGVTWRALNLPGDITTLYFAFYEVLATASNTLFIANEATYGNEAHFWRGSFNPNTPNFQVTWTSDLGPDYTSINHIYPPSATGVAVQVGITDNQILDHSNIQSTAGNTLTNPLYGVGDWGRIKTPGWTNTFNASSGEYFLRHQRNVTNPDRDSRDVCRMAATVRSALLTDPNKLLKLKYHLPKGMKLKLYYTKRQRTSFNEALEPRSLQNLEVYDYDTLFENLIYESATALNDIDFDNEVSYALNPNAVALSNSDACIIYVMIETDESIYQNGTFSLEWLGFSTSDANISSILFSNIVNNKFLIHVDNHGKGEVFSTVDNGNTFTDETGTLNVEGLHPLKHMFLLSPNNPNVFYIAGTKIPVRYTLSSTADDLYVTFSDPTQFGHHDDYRSAYITSQTGTDNIIMGHDGGVSKLSNALNNLQMASLNGDLAVNMAYSLALHEKSGKLLIGLQDNNNFTYQNNVWTTNVGSGDGNLAYIDPANPAHMIYGDPQQEGNNVFYEVGGDFVEDMAGMIIKGEAWLGMSMESYRSYPQRMIIGLQKTGDETDDAEIVINRDIQKTYRVTIPGSSKIGAIGICDRDTSTVYLAEGNPLDNTSKLFRSTNNAQSFSSLGSSTVTTQTGNQTIDNLLMWQFITTIAVNANNAQKVYLGVSGVPRINNHITDEYMRVLKSENGGASFVDWSQGLPAMPVKKLLCVESSNNLIFCAIDGGVYYRQDGMSKWECFSNKLPKMYNTDLDYNYCNKELYLTTYGRGIWKTPVKLYLGTNNKIEITQNTTWSTPREIKENIVVKPGKTLTITTTLSIDADRKIIVEPGGFLQLIGATLKNECGAFWQGIEIWGQSSLSQSTTNQGRVRMHNSTIENAREAIRVWDGVSWNSMGGWIEATGSTFRNNRRSIELMPYHYYAGSVEQKHKTRIVNCLFTWDDNLPMPNPAAAITMFHVNGPLISGSDFIDARTNVSYLNRTNGIHSIDASYKVIGRALSLNPPAHTDFNTTGYDVGTFENLRTGILVTNSNSAATVTIDLTRFKNNGEGVNFNAVNNVIITRNRFEFLTPNPTNINSMYQLNGLNSTNFTIEGNSFYSNFTNGLLSAGTNIQNAGIDNNRIYRNDYQSLTVGTFTQGLNSNNMNNQQASGLTLVCNDYITNVGYDAFNSAQNATEGMKLLQGTVIRPAGNHFSTTITSGAPVSDRHILNTDTDNIKYYWHVNDITQKPVENQGVVATFSTINQNACPALVGNVIVIGGYHNLSDGQRTTFLNQLANVKQQILVKTGDTLMHLKEERAQLVDILMQDLYSDTTAQDMDSTLHYLKERANGMIDAYVVDYYFGRNDLRMATDLLDRASTTPGTTYLADEWDAFFDFKKWYLTQVNAAGFLERVDEARATELRFYRDHTTGLAKQQASNLLCFFLNECQPILLPLGLTRNESIETLPTDGKQSPILIVPNPAQSTFTVTSLEEIEHLRILDLNGKEVVFNASFADANRALITLPGNTSAGLYIVEVSLKKGEVYRDRVMIQN